MEYIKDLKGLIGQEVELKGWLANRRDSKGLCFITLRDGTGFVQCVASLDDLGEDVFGRLQQVGLESAVRIKGNVVADERQMGGMEIQATDLEVYAIAEEYPISKKEHGVEFLMEKRHLWLRSKRQWAIMRVRNAIIYSIHRFFQDRGFLQMDPPIFTGNACEGTTTLFETDFYGQPAYLSQSGQLYGEAMAMSHGLIYTFGPTFRAEKSKTRRHLSEFWMIEPEMAFFDLDQDMDLIEEFLKYVVSEILEKCQEELSLLERDVEPLKKVATKFPRITYDDAVKIIKGEKDVDGKFSIPTLTSDLEKVKEDIQTIQSEIEELDKTIAAGGIKKGKLNFLKNKSAKLKQELKDLEEMATNIPQWIESAKNFEDGSDFGGSDETILTRLYGTPIMVYKWPAAIKAFYMKEDEEDGYVKGVDVLAPEGYGEIVGGGERETNADLLIRKIKEHELPMDAFEWYLDLRRYGSVPHAGFGLGLERLVSWICKLSHIRETIPFPRSYGRLFP